IALKLGQVPDWMQHGTIKNIANNYISDFVNSKGGANGRFSVAWPGILSGKDAPKQESDGPGLVDKIKGYIEAAKNNWEGIKAAVLSGVKGRFMGSKAACNSVPAEKSKGGGGGACHLCMDVKDMPKHLVSEEQEVENSLGHVTAHEVHLRQAASHASPSM